MLNSVLQEKQRLCFPIYCTKTRRIVFNILTRSMKITSMMSLSKNTYLQTDFYVISVPDKPRLVKWNESSNTRKVLNVTYIKIILPWYHSKFFFLFVLICENFTRNFLLRIICSDSTKTIIYTYRLFPSISFNLLKRNYT